MRTLVGFSVALLWATGVYGQNKSGFVTTPGVVRAPSSVLYPAGTSALPGVQRTVGSVVHPAGGNPQIGVPSIFYPGIAPRVGGTLQGQPLGGRPGNGRNFHRNNGTSIYAYPVYVGGYDYPFSTGYLDSGYYAPAAAPPQQQQQPNITVIYPPQQPTPVIVTNGGADYSRPQGSLYQPPVQMQPEEPAAAAETAHYLIAFKDHTIYSAVAYWVDNDTLHYFTSGNTHNQVSLSLVDRELTERLNRESGVNIKLPAR